MISAKLVLVGETGNGKSSLGNFLLERKVFPVSSNPESETKITVGEYGTNKNRNIFVIDTPGLQDTENSDKEHLDQMVNYIKRNPGIQAIIIVLNYHQPRIAMYIKNLVKLLCNVFNDPSFWSHVALVWSKYYYSIPPEEKQKRGEMVEKFMPKILELIRTSNGDNTIRSLPTFFIDSNPEQQDEFSREEANRLLLWAHQLNPIDVYKVKNADPNIKEIIEEEEIRESEITEKNLKYVKKEFYKRIKEIHYDGQISYSNWKKFKSDVKVNILQKRLIDVKVEKKSENHVIKNPIIETKYRDGNNVLSDIVGELFIPNVLKGIFRNGNKIRYEEKVGEEIKMITDYYEREVRYYNDGSIEYGEWNQSDSQVKIDTVKY